MLGKLEAGKPLVVSFQAFNVGDSEAKDLRGSVTLNITNMKEAKWAESDFVITESLAPGDYKLVEKSTTTICLPGWDGTQLGSRKKVQIHGNVSYRDKNGVKRRTGFYRFSTPNLHRFCLPDDKDVERDYEYED
jgi:hypothetical protein